MARVPYLLAWCQVAGWLTLARGTEEALRACAEEAGCAAGQADDFSALQRSSPMRAASVHRAAAAGVPEVPNGYEKVHQSDGEKEAAVALGLPTHVPPMPKDPKENALGLLILTYGYPTQPGDIDDKRSFCTVDENYHCTDGFTVVKAEVVGLLFEVAQNGIYNSTLELSFMNALRALLGDKRVKAITSNCGFMTNYQAEVESMMAKLHREEGLPMKPLLMGTLSLAPLFSNQTGMYGEVKGWSLLKGDERAVVVTANSATLSKKFYSIMNEQGLQSSGLQALLGKKVAHQDAERIADFLNATLGIDDPAEFASEIQSALITWSQMNGLSGVTNFVKNRGKFFRTFGAQAVPGFGHELAIGTDHNVSLATPHMNQWVLDALFRIEYNRAHKGRVSGKFILLECTELPAYANGIRGATRLPVWDITTLANCLMSAAPTYEPSVQITENAAFKDCMMSWTNPYKFDTRFGRQAKDRRIKYYDDAYGEAARPLDAFDWGILGKPTGDRCTAAIGCAKS